MTKSGYGTLVLTGANIHGATTVSASAINHTSQFTNGSNDLIGGTLIVRDNGVLGSGTVTVNAGTRLVLDNTAAPIDRIPDAANLTVAGGELELIGAAAGVTEVVNVLSINAGNNAASNTRIIIDSTAGGVTELQAATLTRNGQATAHFVGRGADLGDTSNSRLRVNGTNPLVNNVVPWATIEGSAGFDLVTDADGVAGAPFYVGRVTSYSNNINSPGLPIVRLDGSEPPANRVLTGNNTIAALLLENGVTISGSATLTMQTGGQGQIVSRTGDNVIATTRLDFGNREPLLRVESGSLEISSNLTGSNTLRKEGLGSLILSGDNDQGAGQQFTAQIQLNAGTLIARHSDAFGTTAGDVNIHDRAALVLDGSLTIGNETLRVRGTGLNNDYSGVLRAINGAT
ncbi:MAG: hypothetical protein KDA55_16585, partial [Planctomycetales bacterium]|nr:hypothetical protein [Planctomycetales bacterium]